MDLSFPLRSGFLALPLEGEAKEEFQIYQERLAFLGDTVSFQKADTPHLTLSYWPELMEIEFRQIRAQAAAIAAQMQSFRFAVEGIGMFGKPGHDEVLYLQPVFTPELATVKKKCPWPNLYDPWQPHITLLRVKHQERFQLEKKAVLKAMKDVRLDAKVNRLRLYANVAGESQVPLEDFPFSS